MNRMMITLRTMRMMMMMMMKVKGTKRQQIIGKISSRLRMFFFFYFLFLLLLLDLRKLLKALSVCNQPLLFF